jgi:hypothetical protein
MDVLSVVSVVCCQVENPAMSRSLVQMSPTDCGASFVCSRNPVNEEAVAHWGLLRQKQTKRRLSLDKILTVS